MNKVQCKEKKPTFADASGRLSWVETVSAESNSEICVRRVLGQLLTNMPRKTDPDERLGALAAISALMSRRRIVLSADLMVKFLSVITEDPHELIFDSARPLFKAAATNGHRQESLGIVATLRKEAVDTYRELGGNPTRRQLQQNIALKREEMKLVRLRIGRARFCGRPVNLTDARSLESLTEELRAMESQVAALLKIERKAFRLDSLARL